MKYTVRRYFNAIKNIQYHKLCSRVHTFRRIWYTAITDSGDELQNAPTSMHLIYVTILNHMFQCVICLYYTILKKKEYKSIIMPTVTGDVGKFTARFCISVALYGDYVLRVHSTLWGIDFSCCGQCMYINHIGKRTCCNSGFGGRGGLQSFGKPLLIRDYTPD